jgi:hypothetical protein
MSRNPKPPVGSRVWYLDPPEKPSKEVIRAAARGLQQAMGYGSKKRKK